MTRRKLDNLLKWLAVLWVALTMAVLLFGLMNAQSQSPGQQSSRPADSSPMAAVTTL